MRAIVFATIKGGVGKTTLAVHTAASLAANGRHVLLVDLDAQAHSTLLAGVDLDPGAPCIGDALLQGQTARIRQVIVRNVRPHLDVAPASLRMASQERQLYTWALRLRCLVRALEALTDQPDIVVVDTPPHIGAFTEAALHAADLTVAPVPALAGALQGLGDLREAWTEMQDGRGGQLVGVVNMVDGRTTATNAAVDAAIAEVEVRLLRTRVRKAEVINQSALDHALIFDTAPSHPATDDLHALATEVLKAVEARR